MRNFAIIPVLAALCLVACGEKSSVVTFTNSEEFASTNFIAWEEVAEQSGDNFEIVLEVNEGEVMYFEMVSRACFGSVSSKLFRPLDTVIITAEDIEQGKVNLDFVDTSPVIGLYCSDNPQPSVTFVADVPFEISKLRSVTGADVGKTVAEESIEGYSLTVRLWLGDRIEFECANGGYDHADIYDVIADTQYVKIDCEP